MTYVMYLNEKFFSIPKRHEDLLLRFWSKQKTEVTFYWYQRIVSNIQKENERMWRYLAVSMVQLIKVV